MTTFFVGHAMVAMVAMQGEERDEALALWSQGARLSWEGGC